MNDPTPADARQPAHDHHARTGHDMALVSAAASNCAECHWSTSAAPTPADDEPSDDVAELLAYADRRGTPGYVPCSALSRSTARRVAERLRAGVSPQPEIGGLAADVERMLRLMDEWDAVDGLRTPPEKLRDMADAMREAKRVVRVRLASRSPQPEITRQQIADAIECSYSTNPPGIIQRATDAVWALRRDLIVATRERVGCITPDGEILRGHFGPCSEAGHRPIFADGATPAGPEAERDCPHLVGDVWPCAGVEGHPPPHVARLWPKPPVGATPAEDDQP